MWLATRALLLPLRLLCDRGQASLLMVAGTQVGCEVGVVYTCHDRRGLASVATGCWHRAASTLSPMCMCACSLIIFSSPLKRG